MHVRVSTPMHLQVCAALCILPGCIGRCEACQPGRAPCLESRCLESVDWRIGSVGCDVKRMVMIAQRWAHEFGMIGAGSSWHCELQFQACVMESVAASRGVVDSHVAVHWSACASQVCQG